MRKKLIALSIALLTIGGSVSSTTVARADVPQTVIGLAVEPNAEFLIIPEGQDPIPVGFSLTGFSSYFALSNWSGSGSVRISYGEIIGSLIEACHEGNFISAAYPNICLGIGDVFTGNEIIQLVVWESLVTGNDGDSEDIFIVTPSTTLPPDFLAPKTYGNPASVTGTAPALPATPVTPTAPAITAGSTSVIYNGVPQSAPYSVDQKSSCSTTYNGSSIPPVTAGSYAVSITCSANSLTSTATTTLTITKATPVISWSTPAAITTATKLSSSQLSAFSYIPGSFTYSSAIGSSLPIGDELITATFTPTDSTNYTSATMTVTIHVTP
jgi:hypothetical protein